MHDQKHKDSPVFFSLLFHFSSVGSRDEMEVAASKVNGGPPPAPPAVQKLPGFRFFSSSGTSAPSQSAVPTVAAAAAAPGAAVPVPARQPNGILKNNYDKDAMNRGGQR